jgi:hypothetical protein
VLEIHDPAIAERLAGYVDAVRARYPRTTPPQIREPLVEGMNPVAQLPRP